jgi:hypothetical protein
MASATRSTMSPPHGAAGLPVLAKRQGIERGAAAPQDVVYDGETPRARERRAGEARRCDRGVVEALGSAWPG